MWKYSLMSFWLWPFGHLGHRGREIAVLGLAIEQEILLLFAHEEAIPVVIDGLHQLLRDGVVSQHPKPVVRRDSVKRSAASGSDNRRSGLSLFYVTCQLKVGAVYPASPARKGCRKPVYNGLKILIKTS